MFFFIFVASFLLIVFLLALYKRQKRCNEVKEIPGLEPTHPEYGNLPDIQKEKGLPSFIYKLHEKFGPIASFWEGKRLAVSVADPNLLKEQRKMNKIIQGLLDPFAKVTGKDFFIGLPNEQVLERRKLYDHHFMLKGCKTYSSCFLEVAKEYVTRWKKLGPDDQIPLLDVMLEATMKSIIKTSYGDYFKDEKSLKHFHRLLCEAFSLIEKFERTSQDEKQLEKDAVEIRGIVIKIMEARRKDIETSDREYFIDVLLENVDITDEQSIADSITFIGASYDVVAKVLMWIFYELATHQQIQEQVHQEIIDQLGDEDITIESIPKLVFLRRVIYETLRLRGITLIGGRTTENEMKIGEYFIPSNTNIYHASGYLLHDKNIWPEPENFDPDRFTPENIKTRHAFAFKPFGFAGKRTCPGMTYALTQLSTFIATWCKAFRFELVPNQTLELFWSFVFLRPKDEIWMTVKPRK